MTTAIPVWAFFLLKGNICEPRGWQVSAGSIPTRLVGLGHAMSKLTNCYASQPTPYAPFLTGFLREMHHSCDYYTYVGPPIRGFRAELARDSKLKANRRDNR